MVGAAEGPASVGLERAGGHPMGHVGLVRGGFVWEAAAAAVWRSILSSGRSGRFVECGSAPR